MTADAGLLVLALLLVLLAGVLVGSETAIGRVSRSQVDELARDNVRGAERLARLLEDRPRYVNALLFLSTVSTVTATVLVGFVAVDMLAAQGGWPAWAALLLTIVVMVVVSYVALGVAPRTLGRQHATSIALRTAGIARLSAALLGPLTNLLILLGNALTPGRGYREGPFATQAELREMVDLAEADSLIEDTERQMIHSVFELGDTFVKEVMVPRTEVVFIEQEKTLRQALSLGLRSGFSRIPVTGEGPDDVVGIVVEARVIERICGIRPRRLPPWSVDC